MRLFNCIFSGIVLSALFFKLAQYKCCSSGWCSLSSHRCCCLLIGVTNSWRPGSLSVFNFLMSINGALCCQKKLKKEKKKSILLMPLELFFSSFVSSSNATGLKKPVVCNNFMIIIYIVLFNLKCIICIQIILFIIMRQSRDFLMIQRKPWA